MPPADRGLQRALLALGLSRGRGQGRRDYTLGRGASDRAYLVAYTRQAQAIVRAHANMIREHLPER